MSSVSIFWWQILKATTCYRKDEDEDEDMKDKNESMKGESGDEGEEGTEGVPIAQCDDRASDMHNLLHAWQHRFEKQIRQNNRGLFVKDIVFTFDPDSIYGSRSAFLKGLMVTATRLQ